MHPNNLQNRGINSQDFVGRDRDHQVLHTLLQTVEHPGIVAIVGMAGVGKTELAIQYGRSHRDDYPGGVAWFSAATFGEEVCNWMQSEFCPDRDLRHLPNLVQRVAQGWREWQDFCANRLALVIIDDVTDYRQQVEPYLPQESRDRTPFRFLLTSRLHLSSPTMPMLELEELDPEAAVTLLARFAGAKRIDADRPTAERLCQRLAYLPLAIALVGCWLSIDVDRTLNQLIESLERKGLDAPGLERDRRAIMLTAEKGLKAAFAVSWAELAEISLSAQQLARVLSLFAAVDLPWKLVTDVVQTYTRLTQLDPPNPLQKEASGIPPLERGARGDQGFRLQSRSGWLGGLRQMWQWICQQFQRWFGQRPGVAPAAPLYVPIDDPLEARGTLLRMSLLSRVSEENREGNEPLYRVHPLLREFFAKQWAEADPDGWALALAQTIAERARRVPANLSWEHAAAFNDLSPHLTPALQILQNRVATTSDPATNTRYKQQATAIRVALVRLDQPVLFERAFTRARETHDRAKAATVAGNPQRANQLFAETLNDYRQVITQARETFPSDSLQLAGYLNRIANLFRDLGSYRDGIPPGQEAVDIATTKASPIKLAGYLNDLALLHYYQGHYSEAEPLYKRSLSIREQQLGADHPDVARSLSNLAVLYNEQGRYSEAEPLLVRSLSIREQQLGANHPDVALNLNNLAELYRRQGRITEAEPLLVRSLSIWEQQLGANHPDVALNLNNLAELYRRQGRITEAESLHLRSLSIREQQLGANHPDIAQSLNNLAVLYQDQRRYSEAETLLVRSLSIREQQLGTNHPNVANSLNNLAVLYQDQRRYSEAEQLYLRALVISRQTLPNNHPNITKGYIDFVGMVQAALAAGQADQLSEDPTTQAILRELQAQGHTEFNI